MPEDSIDEAHEQAEYIRRQYPGAGSNPPTIEEDGSDVIATEPQYWWGIED